MENQRTKQPVGSQKSKPIVSPISPLSSYKSIIIVLCVGILLWMLLQGGTKHGFNFFKRDKMDKSQSTLDKSKETIKNVYDQTTDSARNTIQDVINKVKTGGNNMKTIYDEKLNPMHDTSKDKGNIKDKLSGMKDNFVQTAKDTIDSLKEKSQEAVDTVMGTSKEPSTTAKLTQAAKDTLSGTSNMLHMLDMNGLIEQTESSLEEFLSPRLKIEEQIPTKILSGAKAVVFITVYKGGIGLSGVFGTGIIVARNDIGYWSGPCAIALIGVDIGLNIGVEKSNHVIILRDDSAVRAFASVGQLKLGVDASIAVGPIGRDTSAALSVGDKGYATMSSYSMSKGAYLGLSFEGQIVTVRNDCNEQYYGKKVNALEILDGSVKPPKK